MRCKRCNAGPLVNKRIAAPGEVWHKARGLCCPCWNAAKANGSLDEYDLNRRPARMRDPDVWFPLLDGANCVGTDPEVFFQTTFPTSVAQARAICAGCPAAAACLRWALEHREAGIWAGTTEEQRQQMRASA